MDPGVYAAGLFNWYVGVCCVGASDKLVSMVGYRLHLLHTKGTQEESKDWISVMDDRYDYLFTLAADDIESQDEDSGSSDDVILPVSDNGQDDNVVEMSLSDVLGLPVEREVERVRMTEGALAALQSSMTEILQLSTYATRQMGRTSREIRASLDAMIAAEDTDIVTNGVFPGQEAINAEIIRAAADNQTATLRSLLQSDFEEDFDNAFIAAVVNSNVKALFILLESGRGNPAQQEAALWGQAITSNNSGEMMMLLLGDDRFDPTLSNLEENGLPEDFGLLVVAAQVGSLEATLLLLFDPRMTESIAAQMDLAIVTAHENGHNSIVNILNAASY